MSKVNLSSIGSSRRHSLALAVWAEKARRDVNDFCEYVMEYKGQPWKQAPFHREWQRAIPLEGPSHNQIGAPRESAKTSQTIARILWELGCNPDLRMKVVSATQELADNIVAEIGRHIEQNRRLHLVFPKLRPDPRGPWSRGELLVQRRSLAKDPSVVAAGILSSGAGGRADLIIFDDVCDSRNAIQQPALREQIKHAFYETWLNLLGPSGRAVYIGTVWHVDDLSMEIKHSGEWQVWWRPARDPVTGELLWPERWSAQALAERERKIGPRAFARQYLLEPVSDEERTFPELVLAACRDDRFAPGEVVVPEEWPRYAGVDLAASMGQRASWTVMFTVAVDPESKRRYPLEIVRKRQSFPDTIQMILHQWRKHKHRLIYVETNGFQQAVVQHLPTQDCSLPVRGFHTGSQKDDEQVGIPSLSASMANGSWLLPHAGEVHAYGCECGWCAWRHELELHPHSRYQDCLMAMWFAESAARGHPYDEFIRNFVVYTDLDFPGLPSPGYPGYDYTMPWDQRR